MSRIAIQQHGDRLRVTVPESEYFLGQVPWFQGKRDPQEGFWEFPLEHADSIVEILYKGFGYVVKVPEDFVTVQLTFRKQMESEDKPLELCGFRLCYDESVPVPADPHVRCLVGFTSVSTGPGDSYRCVVREGAVLELRDAPAAIVEVLPHWLQGHADIKVTHEGPLGFEAKMTRYDALLKRRDALLEEADVLSMEIADLEHEVSRV